jgi:hypothetical protein
MSFRADTANMADRLAELAVVKSDAVGLQLEEERLPQRIRTGRPKGARD